MLVLPLVLSGCASDEPGDSGAADPRESAWVAAREACGVDGFPGPPELDADWVPLLAPSATCVDHLAEDVGLDWESFGVTAETVEWNGTRSAAGRVLLGVLALVSSDLGDVAALSEADLPDATRAALLELDAALGGTEAAGALWYQLVADTLDRVRFESDLGDYGAGYRDGELVFAFSTEPPARVASLLVHEVNHELGPGHVECTWPSTLDLKGPGPKCDEHNDGSYGVQATFALALHDRLPPTAASGKDRCMDLALDRTLACVSVNAIMAGEETLRGCEDIDYDACEAWGAGLRYPE